MADKKRAIAVDFGTARTKVAYRASPGHRPELLLFGHDHERVFTPSLFYLPEENGAILFGDAAEEMLVEHPDAPVVDVLKRRLLDKRVRAGGRSRTPLELLTAMLTELRNKAGREIAAFAGKKPDIVALTIPAAWGPTERETLEKSAIAAGFETLTVVEEPVAAARAWLQETGNEAKEIVVLDCGGGTVDWAYLVREGARFRVVPECPPGNIKDIGGYDVDRGLLDFVRKAVSGDPEASAALEARQVRILADLRRLKEDFSLGKELRPVRVSDQVAVNIGAESIKRIIGECFVTPVVEQFAPYLQLVKAANRDRLPPVLFVGGSARLPGLEDSVKALGCNTLGWERADRAPVLGAAIVAGERLGETDYANASDVHLKEQAEAGDADAAYELASRLLGLKAQQQEKPSTRNSADGLKWLFFAAQAGQVDAMAELGSLCLKGVHVAQDVDKAASYLSRAAGAGHIGAMSDLAVILANFDNVGAALNPETVLRLCGANDTPSREKKSLHLFDKAIKGGSITAIRNKGRLLKDAKRSVYNADQSFQLLCEANELGDSDAPLYLASMYENGEVVKKNAGKAVELLKTSAARGNKKALRGLNIYRKNLFIIASIFVAVVLLLSAANQYILSEWVIVYIGRWSFLGVAVVVASISGFLLYVIEREEN